MRVYQVGGSLRDELLGLDPGDRDWVVTGATPEDMARSGFKPVGRDFPVFLHPVTHEEYALARTERKTAPGYRGFVFHSAPEVTLEEDLARRDFTVNAMARAADAPAEAIIDPHGGRADLTARVLRHVGPAFAEDPVRILRGARFVARFGFAVAPPTLDLMRAMVDAGEVDALVPERVWQELARGLMEADPVAMFALLSDARALPRIAPEWTPFERDALPMRALALAARHGAALEVRFACACLAMADAAIGALTTRLRVPNESRDLARLHARLAETLGRAARLEPEALADLLQAADALRQPVRFARLLEVAALAAATRAGDEGLATTWPGQPRVITALAAARAVDASAIARAAPAPAAIPAALKAARVAAIQAALQAAPD
jgi:tRNA nucleotidyltransferase (CCA-adding enzyme)